MSTLDPNRVILTGENPFIRLSASDGADNSTDASFWRILMRNGVAAAGSPWPREREGRPFSTCALAFSESWTEAR